MAGLCGMLWVCCSFGERYVYLQRSTPFCFCASLGWQKNWRCLHAAHVDAVQTGAVQAARREGGAECGLRAAGLTVQGTGCCVRVC